MILFNKAYGTIWRPEDTGKVVRCNLSTSDKRTDENGNVTYENSSWFATFMPKCADKARSLKEKDRVEITSGKVSVVVRGEEGNKKYYPTVLIFDFNPLVHSEKPSEPVEEFNDDEDLPFN